MDINRLKAEGRDSLTAFRRTEAHSFQNMLCSVIHLMLQVLWFRGHLQDPLWLAGGEAPGLLSQQGERPSHCHSPHCTGENRSGVCSVPGRKQVNTRDSQGLLLSSFPHCLFGPDPTPTCSVSAGGQTRPTVICWTCASWSFVPLLAVATRWLWVACWPTASERWRSSSAVMWCWSRGSTPSCAAPSTTGRWTSAVQEAHPHPVGVQNKLLWQVMLKAMWSI